MKLELSLSKDKQVWALSNPEECRSYISYGKEKGVQETILIFHADDRGPKQVDLDEYPAWAQRMILSSVIVGELVNTGDPIGTKNLQEVAKIREEDDKDAEPEVEVIVVKKTGKSKAKGKTRSKKG